MVSTTQQLKIADFQIEQLKRQIVHAKLVEKEVDSLPKDVRTYEGVGRMQVSNYHFSFAIVLLLTFSDTKHKSWNFKFLGLGYFQLEWNQVN